MGAFAGLAGVSAAVGALTTKLDNLTTAATAASAAIRGIPPLPGKFETSQTGALSDLMQGATSFLPENNPWGKLIRDTIKQEMDLVTGGKETIADALKTLQKQLSNFYSDFQQQVADPKTPKDAKDFFNQLIQLVLSGNLLAKKTADAVDGASRKLDNVAQQAGESVAASIGNAIERGLLGGGK